MELGEYLRILRKHWTVIILSIIVAIGLALAFAQIQTPIYRAEVSLQVKPAVFNYNTILTAHQLLNQFALQVHTTTIAQRVLAGLGLVMKPRDLLEQVTVTAVPEDFLLVIDADLPDGELAKQVANAFAQEFVAWHTSRILAIDPLERIEISVLVPANRYWLDWPRRSTLGLAGGLVGIALGVALAFLREYREGAVLRSLSDMERDLGVPALGAIPTAPERRSLFRVARE